MSSSSSSSSSWSSTSALHSSTSLVTPTNSAGDTPVVSHSVADIAGADELLRDGFDDSPPLNPKLQRFQLNMFTETNDENLAEPKELSTRLVGARGPNIPKLSASRAFSVNDLVSYENMFEKQRSLSPLRGYASEDRDFHTLSPSHLAISGPKPESNISSAANRTLSYSDISYSDEVGLPPPEKSLFPLKHARSTSPQRSQSASPVAHPQQGVEQARTTTPRENAAVDSTRAGIMTSPLKLSDSATKATSPHRLCAPPPPETYVTALPSSLSLPVRRPSLSLSSLAVAGASSYLHSNASVSPPFPPSPKNRLDSFGTFTSVTMSPKVAAWAARDEEKEKTTAPSPIRAHMTVQNHLTSADALPAGISPVFYCVPPGEVDVSSSSQEGPLTFASKEMEEDWLDFNARSCKCFDATRSTSPHSHKTPNLAFTRIRFDGDLRIDDEHKKVADVFTHCLKLRKRFVWKPTFHSHRCFAESREDPKYVPPSLDKMAPLGPACNDCTVKVSDGVFYVYDAQGECLTPDIPTWIEFSEALYTLVKCAGDGPCKTWSYSRLAVLESMKKLHNILNHDLELLQQKAVSHRDFYNVRKVDNHVHHSACMNQKHLLRFMKKKMKLESAMKEEVLVRDGKVLTLEQVFQSLNLTAYDLSIDVLDMHASRTFQRFDKFNLKYNPVGESRLREIFLKYANRTKGKHLAEITREVFSDLESNKYQLAEYRVSIYGKESNEWDLLAEWVVDGNLWSYQTRWMIQVPRLYRVYKVNGFINNLQDMLTNIFKPLFEVTLDPTAHPKLHVFLAGVVGFDCVDDESLRTSFFDPDAPPPEEWTTNQDPHYCTFSYYLYANLLSLNKLRVSKGLSTFQFRPHSGEAGDVENVCSSFLLAHGINHGLTLLKHPPIQYLYYLAQVGISMSPLSNNLLFVEYEKNPFPKYFDRGLNVTLSSDDPLMIHVTKEPLVEEYSVAAQVWKLSSIDVCEIARNSCLQSGFEKQFKAHWLGKHYWVRGVNGNDVTRTNVPNIRIQYRQELLVQEHGLLAAYSGRKVDMTLLDVL